MYQLAVVCSDPCRDPTSAQLLAVRHPRAYFHPLDIARLRVEAGNGINWSVNEEAPLPYDALIVRRLGAEGSRLVQYELLELLERQGVMVVNSPAALSLSESKLQTTVALAQAGLPVPATVLAQSLDEGLAAIQRFGQAVIKPLYGELGVGVERVDPSVSPEWLDEQLETDGALYLQEYVPTDGSDLRAFVVGDRVINAMRRVPEAGEWRANIHLGARGEPVTLSPAAARLAVEGAAALGLDYAGMDLIEGSNGPMILEANGTPGWQGLERATGCDVAVAIAAHVVERLDARAAA